MMRKKKTIATISAIIVLIGLVFGCRHFAGGRPQIVKANEDSLYRTRNTPFEATFADKEDATKIVFKKDGSRLSFKLPYEDINWRKEKDKLIADIGDKAFSYSLLRNGDQKVVGLKEEIILKEPPLVSYSESSPNSNSQKDSGKAGMTKQEIQNTFQFTLDLENLTAKKVNGLWRFYGSAGSPQVGKELFFIPKPYMEDASGEKSENVRIDIGDNKLIVTADQEWLLSPERKYPIRIDPSLQLTVLTVHSHPQTGDDWIVEFETEGKADLKIIPNDQATIEDDEFKSLTCGNKKIAPQILEGDVIHVSNWECSETATVIHKTLKAGKHTLRFEFGGQAAYAYTLSESPHQAVEILLTKNTLKMVLAGQMIQEKEKQRRVITTTLNQMMVSVGKQPEPPMTANTTLNFTNSLSVKTNPASANWILKDMEKQSPVTTQPFMLMIMMEHNGFN